MFPMRNDETQISGLKKLCEELLNHRSVVVELGSYWGESAGIFAIHAKRVFCIDPWKDVEELDATADGSNFKYQNMHEAEKKFDANTAIFENVIKVRGASNDVLHLFANRKIDLLYIDSLHTYDIIRYDIDKWWPKIKWRGYIAGHNYHEHWPGVVKAVEESFGKPDHLYEDTSWAIQKVKARKLDRKKPKKKNVQ